MIPERAAPILPARDLAETQSYYERLGFDLLGRAHPDYRMMIRDAWELHFFPFAELDPLQNFAGAYLRCTDIEALDAEWAALDIPHRRNGRLIRAETKPWGMREMALIDLNGTLIRVGQPLT